MVETSLCPPEPYRETSSDRLAVPVLALGSGLTLMGVLRIFGRAKLPVYAVCGNPNFAAHCRWYSEPPTRGNVDLEPSQLTAFLQQIPIERAVLIPCADDWLEAVATLPDSLARRFPSSTAPAEIVQVMINKWSFAELLNATGIPHPETFLIESRKHLEGLPAGDFHGKILKPLSSIAFANKHHVKGYLVENREQALQFAMGIDFPIMLQEFIPGPATAHFFIDGFVDRHGRICARFARQRLRMYPPTLGNSTLMVSVPLTDVADAVENLNHILSSVSYRGIFSAEFKYDYRDGYFKILEINVRPWWYVEFAARCGADVCRLAYLDALDLPVPSLLDYEVGRCCVLLIDDILACRGHWRDGSPKVWSRIRSRMTADGALFAWDDPLPTVTYAGELLTNFLRRHIGGMKRDGIRAQILNSPN